jgi:hypothetical protein
VPRRVDPGYATAALLLAVAAGALLRSPISGSSFGIKGDEATYVAMALSVAHDHDLDFTPRDLQRFRTLYGRGPEGIFLKRGKAVRLDVDRTPPFVHFAEAPSRTGRLFFGKAFFYPVVAAPFAGIAGVKGLLFLHVTLLVGVFLGGAAFVGTMSRPGIATAYALAFVAVSITSLYIVWLTPEVLNFASVFFAFFLWSYKEVAPPATNAWGRLLRSPSSDVAAAALLGLATFSKPLNAPLLAPFVLLALWRRRPRHAVMTAAVFAGTVALCFGANAAITGELNYQGGDRKTFYWRFPFDTPQSTFDNAGIPVATDNLQPDTLPPASVRLLRLRDNIWYFLIGRHSGLVPYYFPAVVAIILCCRRPRSIGAWRMLTLGAVAAIAGVLLLWLPHTWAGGGGAPGNRYFLSLYAPLLFLTPPMGSVWPAVVSWAGGAVFIAHLLIHPLTSSMRPWVNTQKGLLRLLPIEMTMINDLPVMVHTGYGHVPYGQHPRLLLYFLDDKAWLPEGDRIWVAGRAKTQIVIHAAEPLSRLDLSLDVLVPNQVTVEAGGDSKSIALKPGERVSVTLRPTASYCETGACYRLSVETTDGLEPRRTVPGSTDARFLGVEMRLSATTAARPPAARLSF